ncbi:hypothetical protein MSMTP_1265 [Methanosarcina sp. MTP4]|nr:hypothetical protein MSMTP_1265 [Methanosarcina sp. MTP4]
MANTPGVLLKKQGDNPKPRSTGRDSKKCREGPLAYARVGSPVTYKKEETPEIGIRIKPYHKSQSRFK